MADEGRKRKMQRKKGANLMKNLFKKIGALLVAAIMVLAMASTAFADGPTATITANNADNATLTYAQVIRADQLVSNMKNLSRKMSFLIQQILKMKFLIVSRV